MAAAPAVPPPVPSIGTRGGTIKSNPSPPVPSGPPVPAQRLKPKWIPDEPIPLDVTKLADYVNLRDLQEAARQAAARPAAKVSSPPPAASRYAVEDDDGEYSVMTHKPAATRVASAPQPALAKRSQPTGKATASPGLAAFGGGAQPNYEPMDTGASVMAQKRAAAQATQAASKAVVAPSAASSGSGYTLMEGVNQPTFSNNDEEYSALGTAEQPQYSSADHADTGEDEMYTTADESFAPPPPRPQPTRMAQSPPLPVLPVSQAPKTQPPPVSQAPKTQPPPAVQNFTPASTPFYGETDNDPSENNYGEANFPDSDDEDEKKAAADRAEDAIYGEDADEPAAMPVQSPPLRVQPAATTPTAVVAPDEVLGFVQDEEYDVDMFAGGPSAGLTFEEEPEGFGDLLEEESIPPPRPMYAF
jgi:hypothetical protein